MTDALDTVRAAVRRSRDAQGLPPVVTDDAVLSRVADAMRAAAVGMSRARAA